MAKKAKLINKKIFKMAEGKCRICGETDYALLDVHRIKEGKEGGRYEKFNSVSICCKCHRKVHDGQILIQKYCLCSNGQYLLLIVENGQERFV